MSTILISAIISPQQLKKNTILLLLSSIELTASNTSYLKEGEKGIDRLVPDDGDGDLDDVGVGEQGSTSRQLHPCSGEPPTLRPGMPADRKSTRLNSSHITRSRMPSSA